MQFIKLSAEQMKKFLQLKTSRGMHRHGPLKKGEEVPIHTHDEVALYVVQGLAKYQDGTQETTTLGKGVEYDAVRVDAGDKHGWLALLDNTIIPHTLGARDTQAVLAA